MLDSAKKLIDRSEVIIINTKEKEFFPLLTEYPDKIIIDMVRLDDSLLNNPNYKGINW